MGFRTVVILDNDRAGDWESDPMLGEKISSGMNHVNSTRCNLADLGYGRVVECAHTSQLTLALITPFHMDTLSIRTQYFGRDGRTQDEHLLSMLKEYADKLGYRLTKKSVKKETQDAPSISESE